MSEEINEQRWKALVKMARKDLLRVRESLPDCTMAAIAWAADTISDLKQQLAELETQKNTAEDRNK